VHGSYRKVAETAPALDSVSDALAKLDIRRSGWLFDRPVSNSGRIRSLVAATAAAESLDWSVELVDNPDQILKSAREIVATSDSAILDQCWRWFNLARHVVETQCAGAFIVDLGA